MAAQVPAAAFRCNSRAVCALGLRSGGHHGWSSAICLKVRTWTSASH